MEHSEWSPSGFQQVMLCPGSKVLQAPFKLKRTSSVYAAEGTVAHLVLTWCLTNNLPAHQYIGCVVERDGFSFTVDDDMARHVQVCADYVKDVAGDDGIVLVDRKVSFGQYIDQPEGISFGTLDVAVLRPLPDDTYELVSIDFKYGMGVEVSAGEDVAGVRKPNPQLALYGLGILAEVQDMAEISRVRLVISQPRTSVKPNEYDLSLDELLAWGRGPARSAVVTCIQAERAELSAQDWQDLFLSPGEKQCRFCDAKATCPALRETVMDAVGATAATPDDFIVASVPGKAHIEVADVEWLAASLGKVDLIEDWCKAVRAETERRMLAGETVPGYKIVRGKQGNRSWTDVQAAEDLLRKTFRLPVEEAFDLTLISPTSAEKLFKAGKIGPRQWPKAEALVGRTPGKPHVAPMSDARPAMAITPVVNDFVDQSAEEFS
jgi:hypothetical protein